MVGVVFGAVIFAEVVFFFDAVIFLVAGVAFGEEAFFATAVFFGVFLMAHGIISSIPIRILPASLRLLTDTISLVSIRYFAEIAEIVSPDLTVCTTPDTGGTLRI